MKTIILINGKKRSGKDFSASILTSKLSANNSANNSVNNSVTTIPFAGPLKFMAATILGISLEELDTYKNNPENYGIDLVAYHNNQLQDNQRQVKFGEMNFRRILQRLGTDAMCPIFGDKVWSDLFVSNIEKVKEDFIIVPDFRYPSEYQGALETGYRVITLKIRNDNCDTTDPHPSEISLDDFKFDYEINNTRYNKSIEGYIDNFINKFINKKIN